MSDTSTQTITHPSDEALAALADDAAAASADVKAHAASCARCSARVDELRAVARSLHVDDAPSVVDAVVAQASGRAPARRASWLPLPALAAAAACALLLVPLATRDEGDADDDFRARGDDARGPEIALVVDGAPLAADAGSDASVASGATLRADLARPPEGVVVVVARDAAGAVRWLRPAFTDASAAPPCPAPFPVDAAARPALSVAPETVTLAPAPGPLVVRALVVTAPSCSVASLDAALDRAWDAPEGARVVDELVVTVRP